MLGRPWNLKGGVNYHSRSNMFKIPLGLTPEYLKHCYEEDTVLLISIPSCSSQMCYCYMLSPPRSHYQLIVLIPFQLHVGLALYVIIPIKDMEIIRQCSCACFITPLPLLPTSRPHSLLGPCVGAGGAPRSMLLLLLLPLTPPKK